MLRTSGRQDWATPWWFFNYLNDVYQFELDACATAANTKVQGRYYTIRDNGLVQPWADDGWTFFNPPYGNIEPWVQKAVAEARLGRPSVGLLPALGMTARWFADINDCRGEVNLYRPRIAFVGAQGKKSPNGMTMTIDFVPPHLQTKKITWIDVSYRRDRAK